MSVLGKTKSILMNFQNIEIKIFIWVGIGIDQIKCGDVAYPDFESLLLP